MLLKENAIKRYLNVIRKLKLERTGKEERTSGRSKKKKSLIELLIDIDITAKECISLLYSIACTNIICMSLEENLTCHLFTKVRKHLYKPETFLDQPLWSDKIKI